MRRVRSALLAALLMVGSAAGGPSGEVTTNPSGPSGETRIQFGTVDPALVPALLRRAGASDGEVQRERFVEFDPVAVADDLRRAAAGDQTVRLLLFDDEDLSMTTTGILSTFAGIRWTGTTTDARGSASGWASFTYAYGTASWSISHPGGAEYAVLPVDGRFMFRVIRLFPDHVRRSARQDDAIVPLASLPGVAGDVVPATAEATDATAVGAVPIEADTGTVVDVLVAYTAAARAFAGGTSQVQNAIAASLNNANVAYANSRVGHRVRLIASYETSSPVGAVDLETGLAQVTAAGDGVVDEAHRFRDSVGADVVLLWHDFVDSCGLAYVMTQADAAFARYAFAAIDVEASCHGSWNTVAHEIGHLMASQHNAEDASQLSMLPYGYGYQQVLQPRFITVMAYPGSSCPTCPRIPYFSNPLVAYSERPVGTDLADNVRAMAATDEPVASFRTSLSETIVAVERSVGGDGYWTVSVDGRVRPFGKALHVGDLTGLPLVAPVVDIAADPDGAGYWLTASDGGMFAFAATFSGSTGALRLNSAIVGTAAPPGGGGYWMVAADGGIFTFGAAQFLGSQGGAPLNRPVVGMAPTPSGRGYWLVASDGGIFTFGDAPFLGSQGGSPLNRPVVGMAPTPSGRGYWLVATDGGIFTFGDAQFLGSQGGAPLNRPVVGMASTPSGRGYWLVASDGGIFTFGDAVFYGAAALG